MKFSFRALFTLKQSIYVARSRAIGLHILKSRGFSILVGARTFSTSASHSNFQVAETCTPALRRVVVFAFQVNFVQLGLRVCLDTSEFYVKHRA